MTDLILTAACYLAMLLAGCYACAVALRVVTSPEAVRLLSEAQHGYR